MLNLRIYVTSSNRADKLLVFDNISENIRKRCVVVVPKPQIKEYLVTCVALDVTCIAAPEGYEYIAQKRQWCTEICDTKYFCMMDDDLTFYKRENGKIVKAGLLDSEALFSEAVQTMEDNKHISLVGVSGRYMNNAVSEEYIDTARMHRLWFFDVDVYRELGINMCPFPKFVMEDFHMILSFLKAGHNNRVFYKWIQDHKGSNTEGGCSTFRTPEVIKKSALWLQAQHPDVVKVLMKTSKTGWEGMEKLADGTTARMDVNVQWKKAYKPKTEKRAAPNFFF